RENQRPAGLAQLAGDRLVARHEAVAPVDHQDEEIVTDNRALAMLDDELVQRILARAVQAAGLEQLERPALPDRRTSQRVSGRARNGGDNGAAMAGNLVKQRR